MIASHLLALLVFSGLVSAVFAALLRDDPVSRRHFAARLFLGFVVSVLVLGWLMAPSRS